MLTVAFLKRSLYHVLYAFPLIPVLFSDDVECNLLIHPRAKDSLNAIIDSEHCETILQIDLYEFFRQLFQWDMDIWLGADAIQLRYGVLSLEIIQR